MNKFCVLGLGLLLLPACAPMHYENGKSSSDVPAQAHTVFLKDVYMVDGLASSKENDAGVKYDLPVEQNPSQNDQEVVAVVKKVVLSKLSSLGYTTVESADTPADVVMKVFVDYVPEQWPLIDRSIWMKSRVYALDGTPLFYVKEYDQNSFGVFGAIAGPSRDEMVTSTTQKMVDETVKELRNGAKHSDAKSPQ